MKANRGIQRTGFVLARLLAAMTLWSAGMYGALAADRCVISDWPLHIPDGRASFLKFQPQSIAAPHVVVMPAVRLTAHSQAQSPPPAVPIQPPRAVARRPRPIPANDQQRLYAAVVDGRIEEVRTLLESPDVNVNAGYRNDTGVSLIDLAAGYGLPEITHALIKKGARVRRDAAQTGTLEVRPIAKAVSSLQFYITNRDQAWLFANMPARTPERYERTIQLLLEAGADPNEIEDPIHPEFPLGLLASAPPFEAATRIAQQLLDHGANLDGSASAGSPLISAIASGRDDFVTLMLSARRASVPTLSRALREAASRQNLEIAKRLLEAGAEPNVKGDTGTTLLCEALERGPQGHPLAALLVAHHADVNAACRRDTPLLLAADDRELVRSLLEHGADPNATSASGATALTLARADDHELIDLLLAHGARIGFISSELQDYQLHGISVGFVTWSILHHQDYLAAQLIERSPPGTVQDCGAVVYAASTGSSLALNALLKRGADPNSTSERGISALMAAAYHGETAALEILLRQPRIEVNQTTPTRFNRAALTFYSESNPPLFTGQRTALMYASVAGNDAAYRLLLAHGARADQKDAEGMMAVDYGGALRK
jgi:ankyrin repeat protein